jgi:hypothetical protein
MKYEEHKPLEVKILDCIKKDLFGEKAEITEEDYPKLKNYLKQSPAEILSKVYELGLVVSKGTVSSLRSFLDDALTRENLIVPYIYEKKEDVVSLKDLKNEIKRLKYQEFSVRNFLYVMEYLGMGELIREDKKIVGFKRNKNKIEKFYDIKRLVSDKRKLEKERFVFEKRKLIYTGFSNKI